jgi:hypothetical protein
MSHPADKNYFERYYAYLGQDLSEFALNLLWSPQRVIQTVGGVALLRYGFHVFAPWLFLLPWFSPLARGNRKQLFGLVMILPSLLSAALASYPPLRSPAFHYVLELWPVLAFLAILGFAIQKSPRWIWAWAVFSLFTLDSDPLTQFRHSWPHRGEKAQLESLIAQLPQEDSVMADELAGPLLASRKWITRFPDTWVIPGGCPDYLLLQGMDADKTAQIDRLQKKCGKVLSPLNESQDSGAWRLFALR